CRWRGMACTGRAPRWGRETRADHERWKERPRGTVTVEQESGKGNKMNLEHASRIGRWNPNDEKGKSILGSMAPNFLKTRALGLRLLIKCSIRTSGRAFLSSWTRS